MTLDNFVEADILSTCNALGSEIKGIYEKGKDCIECLKDILRYLKRDNEDHSVLRFLGSIRLLQTDLLPIIKQYDKDKEVFDFTLRILVALTNPALLLYREDLPEDKISRNVYLQLISNLQSYKKAFVDLSVWKVFYEHLKDLLKIRPVERSSNESLFIERIIILIRNVLHVPSDDSVRKITDDDLSPHDKILQCLHESKINTLLLYMSANEEEHQFCLHVLEIMSLMFREHTPDTLANCNETRSNAEKEKDLNVLLATRKREQNLKLQKIQSKCASRFNGVYYVRNMKSISDKDYISHRLVENSEDIKFDLKKDAKRKPKNRVRAADIDNSRQSTLSIRLFLKKFCIEFLKTYNKVMVSVKREILRKVSEEHDDTYYLWAISYFMEFNRLHNFQPALVSETITTQSFHHIQTQITNYQEMMLTDKKKTMFWAKRMQLGVNAYKELLETLKKMEGSEDEIIRKSADALISHVFYVIEYREMLLSLLSSYDEVKFPLSYLAKLVESAHLFLKMLENHSKKHSEIIVQKKQRRAARKKKKKIVLSDKSVNVEDQLNEQWDAVTSELSDAVQGWRVIPDVTPFDCASAMSFEEQKIEAIYKIREALISNEPCKALGLLRAARELWPEGDSFGSSDIEPEPEFLVLREIHFSNLQRHSVESNISEAVNEDFDSEDEEIDALPSVTEQKLDMNEIYKRYASHKVVQPCSLLLANYRKNKPQTNICLIKFLHRIAWHCKMHALFFQSSMFLTFQKIFHDPDINFDPIIKEFYRFAKFIVQKFFVAAEKNDKIFVELLFWKGPREAYELEEGYGTSESRVKGWTEDEEEELKYLYEENKDIYIEGQYVADIILANFNTRNRTKPQIISALKRLSLIKSVKDLKPAQRKEWLETEIIELQNLFEDYRNSEDVMTIILDKLSIKRSKKAVVEKLLELNLIKDRKELRKKSRRNHKKSSKFSDSDDNSSGENEDNLYNEENYNPHVSAESSGDEDEINFFKNLEAERFAEDENNMSRTEKNINAKAETNKLSEIWEEHEIMKLTTLYEENRESDNVMDILLNELPRKRSKKSITEKLLELGLIKDKKEINKKRNFEKSKKERMHNSDSKGNNADLVDNDSNPGSDHNESLKNTVKKSKSKRQFFDSSDEDIPLSDVLTSENSKIAKNGTAGKPKRKNIKIWDEKEIIELNQLFLEHKDSDDIVSNIKNHLTFKQTKKSIAEKLLEIGLIKDKTEIKKRNSSFKRALSTKLPIDNDSEKEKRKKHSKIWDETEIIELNQLFLEHKDSEDMLSNIMNSLSFKQTKKNVVQKLLESGLIKDKTELTKSSLHNRKFLATADVTDASQNVKRKKYSEVLDKQETTKNHSKSSKKAFSDSSDDESLPLGHAISTAAKGNITNNFLKVDSSQVTNNSDSSTRNSKRKRVFIDSDDSSDDDANLTNEFLNNNAVDPESLRIDLSEQNGQDHVVTKLQKKKMRVLDDSDDSE